MAILKYLCQPSLPQSICIMNMVELFQCLNVLAHRMEMSEEKLRLIQTILVEYDKMR